MGTNDNADARHSCYNQGYTDACDEAYDEGEVHGYDTGYKEGYREGHSIGFEKGNLRDYADGYAEGSLDLEVMMKEADRYKRILSRITYELDHIGQDLPNHHSMKVRLLLFLREIEDEMRQEVLI